MFFNWPTPKPAATYTIHLVKRNFTRCGIRTTDLRETDRYVVHGDWDDGNVTCKGCKAAR